MRATRGAWLILGGVLLGCSSAPPEGPCPQSKGASGIRSPRGNCVYPSSYMPGDPDYCYGAHRFASGECVEAEDWRTCGCPTPGSECASWFCADGLCVEAFLPDGLGCQSEGQSGTCVRGGCCTGCHDGSTCYAGTSNEACGRYGTRCQRCETSDPCCSARCDGDEGYCTADLKEQAGCCGGPGERCCPQSGCEPGLDCQILICGEDWIARGCASEEAPLTTSMCRSELVSGCR